MSLAFAGGGIVAGVFLGWVHVHVLANMALLTVGGYRYVGAWAFFLNGTASAIATAVVLGIPLGLLAPRLSVRLALIAGAVAALFLVYAGLPSATEHWSWVFLADALQLPLLLILGAWLVRRRGPDGESASDSGA